MPRVDLNVPFAEKDQARSLGARWDPERRTWFVPDGLNAALFQKWLPAAVPWNVRAQAYFIARVETPCWKCGAIGPVHAFLLSKGHETLEVFEEDGAAEWTAMEEDTIIHYVDTIPMSVVEKISSFTKAYRRAFSKMAEQTYWMNHCEHCGMKQGDFELHCEPEGAFMPIDPAAARMIELHAVDEPFMAKCGSYSFGVNLIEFMKRA